MKKSLIALAVAGTFAAPAFAATSNVDIYGKLHMSVSFYDDVDTDGDSISETQFSSNASRFGLKGTEDLGGGLAALWQIETGVNLDEQTGTLASRNSFVGVKGGFGTVLLGNHDTPLKLVGRSLDLFGDTIADSRNVLGGASDARARNVVAYVSPTMTGVTVVAAYTNDLDDGNGNDGDAEEWSAWNANVTYANGPLYLAFAYGDGDYHDNNGLNEHMRFGAGYTMGDLKFVAQYDMLDDQGGNDYDAWMLGAAYTMGSLVLKANYMDGEVDGAPFDITQWTLGVDYNLSKRTTVYALYVDGENVCLGCGAGSSDRMEPDNEDISAFSVGVTHSF